MYCWMLAGLNCKYSQQPVAYYRIGYRLPVGYVTPPLAHFGKPLSILVESIQLRIHHLQQRSPDCIRKLVKA